VKRFILLLLAAGGAALWWKNRSANGAESWTASETDAHVAVSQDPPKLGGDVDAELLAILACPLDKQPVTREGNYLVCQECHRHYPIREGIPVMLIDEALTPEQAASAPA
jgi:uncharacterized protein YbaR (Trm112 family)